MASFNAAHLAAVDAASRQRQRSELMGMNAYDRHKRFLHDLSTYYGGTLPSSNADSYLDSGKKQQAAAAGAATATGAADVLKKNNKLIKTDEDVLRESYRFIRTAEDDAEDSWSVRLAKKYYSRLFKEYCIADLSRYEEGKLGLRWRTQKEVVSGRGQFSCGTRGCEERRGLASFEVPFGYIEAGEKKQALVKVRLCPEHAYQLSYKKNRKAEKLQAPKKRSKHRKLSKEGLSSSSSGSEDEEDEDADDKGEGEEVATPSRKKKAKRTDDGFEEFFTGLFE